MKKTFLFLHTDNIDYLNNKVALDKNLSPYAKGIFLMTTFLFKTTGSDDSFKTKELCKYNEEEFNKAIYELRDNSYIQVEDTGNFL